MDDEILNYIKPKLTADQFSKFLYVFEHGKRIRPRLMQQVCKYFGVPFHPLLAAASAIEIMHCASLMHDDVVDDEEDRRGKQPFFRKYGNHAAILFGDLFAALSLDILFDEFHKDIHKSFIRTFRDLVEGQLMEFETIKTLQDYYQYIDLKTSKLFLLATEVPYLYYKLPSSGLKEFGMLFGKAFQIQDDLASSGKREHSILNYMPSPQAQKILNGILTDLKRMNLVEESFLAQTFQ